MTGRANRPSIFQIGQVTETGDGFLVSGWGLGLCASRCTCHRNPVGGQLAIYTDGVHGRLGLVQFRECTCCEPWSTEELAAVLRDLEAIDAIPTTPTKESQT